MLCIAIYLEPTGNLIAIPCEPHRANEIRDGCTPIKIVEFKQNPKMEKALLALCVNWQTEGTLANLLVKLFSEMADTGCKLNNKPSLGSVLKTLSRPELHALMKEHGLIENQPVLSS